MASNVCPSDLNYTHYDWQIYDEEIVSSIPGYRALHAKVRNIVKENFLSKPIIVLELGIGTGLTASVVMNACKIERYCGIDFSEKMLLGSKERFENEKIELILADYATFDFPGPNDLIISVLGIHHQCQAEAKRTLFRRIRKALSTNGIFLFADLFTFRDRKKAALAEARHYHYLVEHAHSEQSLQEWAFHHRFLNELAALEDHLEWLREAGFSQSKIEFEQFNTGLISAR